MCRMTFKMKAIFFTTKTNYLIVLKITFLVTCLQNAVQAFLDGTVLKPVQTIFTGKDAPWNATVLKRRFAILCVDAWKDWT